MMDAPARLELMEIFRENAFRKRREALALLDDEYDSDQRKEQNLLAEKDKAFEDEYVTATSAELGSFRNRQDSYDTAIKHALMENERALEAAKQHRELLENSAQRLPDGRPVFKTQDRLRVFDRDGNEISHDTIDPETIPDSKPAWERFKAARDEETGLERNRSEFHTLQSKVDNAREKAGKDGVSKTEIDAIGATLEKDMPDDVRQKLGINTDRPMVLAPVATDRPGTGLTVRPVWPDVSRGFN